MVNFIVCELQLKNKNPPTKKALSTVPGIQQLYTFLKCVINATNKSDFVY